MRLCGIQHGQLPQRNGAQSKIMCVCACVRLRACVCACLHVCMRACVCLWVCVLTLDVDGDAGLLAVGDCLVGGLAGDLLACLHVGGGQVQGAHRALPPAIPQQRLHTEPDEN